MNQKTTKKNNDLKTYVITSVVFPISENHLLNNHQESLENTAATIQVVCFGLGRGCNFRR